MALIKNPKTTEENRAARRRNGRQSQGATTTAGKERIRAANLKHGYYSKIREEALAALGENPQDLAALIAGAHEQFQPANAFQADLVDHLAGLRWRMRRAERMQESAMVEKIRAVESRRHGAALQVRYRYADISDFLATLRQAVGRPDYFTHPCFIQRCTEVMKYDAGPAMQAILEMLLILRRPKQFAAALPPPLPEALPDSEWEKAEDLYFEGDASDQPHPEIAVAEGDEREPLRAELRTRLDLEIATNEDSWGKTLAEAEAPLSLLERDRLAIEVQKENTLMRREESACFREFWRLGTILGKMQEEGGGWESELRSQASEGGKRKAKGRHPTSEERTPRSELGTSTPTGELPMTDLAPAPLTPDTPHLTPSRKNEGDSGDVHENKEGCKTVSAAGRPVREASEAVELLEDAEETGKKSELCSSEQGHLPQQSRAAA